MSSKRDKILVNAGVAVFLISALLFLVSTVRNALTEEHRVFIDNGDLVVDSYGGYDRAALEGIEISDVSVFRLESTSKYWPVRRIAGSSSMRHGYYQLRNGDRGFLDLRDGDAVLCVRLSDRLTLLISGFRSCVVVQKLTEQFANRGDQVSQPLLDLTAFCNSRDDAIN